MWIYVSMHIYVHIYIYIYIYIYICIIRRASTLSTKAWPSFFPFCAEPASLLVTSPLYIYTCTYAYTNMFLYIYTYIYAYIYENIFLIYIHN